MKKEILKLLDKVNNNNFSDPDIANLINKNISIFKNGSLDREQIQLNSNLDMLMTNLISIDYEKRDILIDLIRSELSSDNINRKMLKVMINKLSDTSIFHTISSKEEMLLNDMRNMMGISPSIKT